MNELSACFLFPPPNNFVIPTEAYPNSCFATSDRSTCAAFIKESRIKFASAINFDRNSGERSGGICGVIGPKRLRILVEKVLTKYPAGAGSAVRDQDTAEQDTGLRNDSFGAAFEASHAADGRVWTILWTGVHTWRRSR